MSTHGRSIFQYFNEDDEVWIPIPVGDLVSVEYADKVYAPATAELIISNKDMNKPLGTDADIAAGVYSVEGGAITNPTFYRYQQIRLLHMPRPLIPIKISHNSDGTQAVFTYSSHGMAVGTYVQIVNEESGTISDDLYKIDTVPSSSTFTLDKRGTGTASQTYSTSLPGDGASGSQVAYIQYRSDQALFPYFYGKIDSLDVSYSDAVGKTIHIEASDYLRSLATEPVTKSIQSSTSTTQAFHETRIVQADAEEDGDQGKFRDVRYDNTRLSATVNQIMGDWSVGMDLYADNTYNGSNTLGVTKFEDSSFVHDANALEKTKTYKNARTTALNAMKSVAMTDPHYSTGLYDDGGYEIYYGTVGSLVTSGTADVLIVYNGGGGTGGVGDTAHLYENGNLVDLFEHETAGSPTPTTIESGTYIVHSKTDYTFKIKTLDGDVVQSTANTATSAASGTPSTIYTAPQSTGNQGYDFYLDAGLYGDVTLTSNTHRPHLNYFQRKTRPIDPESTGLTAVYPTDDNMEEDDTAFGTKGYNQTKVFILQDFDHGLFDEDLYTQVALQSTDSTGMAKNENNLGHKLEMIKVNSISNADYVADLSSGHLKYSGDKYGNALFHWNRADDARAYGWYSVAGDIDSALKVNTINANFFASNATISDVGDVFNEREATDYASKGTYGVLEADHGGFRRGEVTGMSGLSNLPRGGRPISQSAADSTNGTSTNMYDDFHDATNVSRAINSTNANGDRVYGIDMGAESVASANLIKDMYWCEKEGLLGTEVTGTHDNGTSIMTITSSAHGLETGCLIKVTQISSSTSGTVHGVKVNASPDAPTTANTTGASTRDNGSYFRVEWATADTFNITLPQKHKDHYRDSSGAHSGLISFSGTPTTTTFKYKPVFNVFKDACRVQWQSGNSWTTKEDSTVFDSSLVKGAQHILVSDIGLRDRPYRGVEVNGLLGSGLPGDDFTSSSLKHPTDFNVGSTEAGSYFGFTTVPFCLEADFQAAGDNVTTANVHRYGSDSDDDVRILFKYGDYISETRFLYGDSGLTGVVGRDRGDADGGAGQSSKDVFKTVNCKVIERFATTRSISKTYRLDFNESLEAPNSARTAAAAILKRVILPAQRTTFQIIGYPTVKLIGQGQDGSTGNFLTSAQNFGSYGGRAGMLLEKLDAGDGQVTDSTLVSHLNTTTDVVTAPISGDWDVGTYYRAFIHLRAGMSIRVSHTAAGVIGNHILTGLKYNERGGTATSMISTTGYDEAIINLMHGNLAHAINTVKSTANQDIITVTDSAGYAVGLANIQYDKSGTTGSNGPFYFGDP